MTNPAFIYKKSSVDSKVLGETPHGLIRLLFEKLDEKLSEAKSLIEKNNSGNGEIEVSIKIANALRLSTSIVQALTDSLVKNEGDTGLYDQLNFLYAHLQHQILMASMNFDGEPVAQSLNIVKELSEAWNEIPTEFHEVTAK